MVEFLRGILASDFMPHGHCYFWRPEIVWLHALSDGITGLSYLVIPFAIWYFVRRRADLAFPWMFLLFAIFILSCGATHLMAIVTLWNPVYRLEGAVKAVTAVSSFLTAVVLVRSLPRAVAIPGPAHFRAANDALQREVEERKHAEEQVRGLNAELEARVAARTAELQQALERLQTSEERFRVALKNSPISVYQCDGHLVYTWIHNPHPAFLPEEIVGKTDADLLPAEHAHKLAELKREVLRNGTGLRRELSGSLRGDRRCFDVSVEPIRTSAGEIEGLTVATVDITDRKHVEDALRKSEDRFRRLIELSPVGIAIGDFQGGMSYANPACLKLLGYEPTEIQEGKVRWTEITPPEWLGRDYDSAAELQEKGVSAPFEKEYIRKDGSRVPVLIGSVLLENPESKATEIVAFITDITRRKQIEAELQESRERLDIAQSAAHIGTYDWHLPTNRVIWTEEEERLFGLAPGAFEGNIDGWKQRVLPEDLPVIQAQIQDAMSRGARDLEYEFRIRRTDGEIRWIAGGARFTYASDGTPLRMIGTNQDITDRKNAEEALRNSETLLRQMTDAMPQLVWTTRPDGYHDYYNKRWYEYIGRDYAQSKGEGWNDPLHPEDQQRAWERWSHSLRTGEPYEIEYRFRRGSDGCYRWFLGRAMPICGDDGQIIRWFGTCTDIHDQKRAEEELRQRNEDLNQFAYAVSHDLQEPLRMISIYSQLLDQRYRSSLGGDASTFLQFIVEGAGRMETLLRDLLAYSRVTGAKDRVSRELVETDAVLHRALLNLKAALEESAAEITAETLPGLRMSDSHLLQLFQNLIGNAIKYRREEAPRIQVSASTSGVEHTICIADNGQGIQHEYLDQVFGIFKRLHGKEVPGTGIGLALCKKIVERYGGRIWAESEPGHGSRFCFTVPV